MIKTFQIGIASCTDHNINWTDDYIDIVEQDEQKALDRAIDFGYYRNVRVREIILPDFTARNFGA